MSDAYNCEENCIEWLTNKDVVSVTFSQKKFKNKIKKLAEKYPDEVEIIAENKDGSIFAHIPLEYITVKKPKQVLLTDEQREILRNRMLEMSRTSSIDRVLDTDFDEIEDEP